MRPSWRLLERSAPQQSWRDLEVLLSFNGPQLVIVQGSDGIYLSVASDEGPESTRWLRTRLSALEKTALLLGAVTVRECILKPEIWVVDTNLAGDAIMEALVVPDSLSEEDRPGPDSFLPPETIAEHRRRVQRPIISLDGPAMANHAVGFRVLADLLKQLQRLWNAIGQARMGVFTAKGKVPQEILQKSELVLDGVVPGSVALQIRPVDEGLFADIATQYGQLVSSSGNPSQLGALLRELKARVRATYADYLATVRRYEVEILTRWSTGASFLTPTIAARAGIALDHVEDTHEERAQIRGYFIAFNLRDATFEFHDPVNQERYQGNVSPQIIRSSVPIVIGSSAEYVAEISIVTTHAVDRSPRHFERLESFRIQEGDRGAPDRSGDPAE